MFRFHRRWRAVCRYVKYRLDAADAPDLSTLLQGRTVVVVGSAPGSARPPGWDASWCIVSINASQMAARDWLPRPPDLTLMQFNQIEGTNRNAVEVRRVLRGQRTGLLCLLHWRHDRARLERGLAAFGYGYDALRLISRHERMALMQRVTGRLSLELDADAKWSNGIVATALALHGGAANVILTGINPASQGHGYNGLALPRLHGAMDAAALRRFAARGDPVFTADPEVAQAAGLPLWTGKPPHP